MGRVQQLLQSYEQKDVNSAKIGWRILRIARFADSTVIFETGKQAGYEAERRAHYYWRYVLCQPQHLKSSQMGFSRIWKDESLRWIQTPGSTETVEMGSICERSTWNYVTNSPGFLGELDEYAGRDLRLLHNDDAARVVPKNYEKFNLAKINHKNVLLFEPTPAPLKSSAPIKSKGSVSVEKAKNDNNGSRDTKRYTGAKIGIYPCLTKGCNNPSSSLFNSSKCEQCSSL